MPFHYGDVVWADLDPAKGHEQTKRRPLVVVSNERYNRHCTLSMVVPITSKETGYPLHIAVGAVPVVGGGTPIKGFAEAEQLKALDLTARDAVVVGHIDETGMAKILGPVLGCLVTPTMTIVD